MSHLQIAVFFALLIEKISFLVASSTFVPFVLLDNKMAACVIVAIDSFVKNIHAIILILLLVKLTTHV